MNFRKNKFARAVISLVLAAAMMLPVQASGINSAKSRQQEIQKEIDKNKAQAGEIEKEKSSAEQEAQSLQENLEKVLGDVASTQKKLEDKQDELFQTQKELSAAQEKEAEQYASMKKRIQFMYENGNTAFLETLLTCGSITELINQAEYFNSITEYDRNMLTEYEETKNSIEEKTKKVEKEYDELEALEKKLKKQKAQVETLVEKKKQAIAALKKELSNIDSQNAQYASQLKEQQELVDKLEKEAKAAEEAKKKQEREAAAKQNSGNSGNSGGGGSNSNSSVNGSGALTWPCPGSRRITSYYGQRESPTEGASSFHKGIDIGAPTGTAIVAADEGTVVDAGSSASMGIYVKIKHNNGLQTIYMHCSAKYVSAGQQVTRGQKIAAVGNTGISTGSHLHFGVMKDGSYVNPLSYL